MSDSTPVQRFALKLASAFEDLEKELAPGVRLGATLRPGRPRAQFPYGKVLILFSRGRPLLAANQP
jgi:hypothetical protein